MTHTFKSQVVLVKYGETNSYKFETVKQEELSVGQVRIDIKYIGISFTDLIIKRGYYQYQKEFYPLPMIQGFEFGGVISEVLTDETEYKTGDEVIGISKFGCFANQVCINKEQIFLKTENYSLEEVVCFPVNFFTAYHALHNIYKIQKGSTVLINSAAGGVGGMLVQLSKKLGLKTVTLVGDLQNKRDYVKSLGADYLTEKLSDQFLNSNNLKIDVIFDSSGNFNPTKYRKYLNLNTRVIFYGFGSLVNKNFLSLIKNFFAIYRPKLFDLVYNNISISGFNIIKFEENSRDFIDTKNSLIESLNTKNLLVPKIRLYPFEKIEEAIESLADRNNFGKVIVKV